MKVEISKKDLEETELLLRGLALDGKKILARSLNKTITRGQKRSSEEIRKQVNLKASYVKTKLRIYRASYSRLSARLSAEKRGVLMTRYPYSILKSGGASVKIKRTGARAKIPNAFLVNLRAGSESVQALAVRDSRGGRYKTGNSRIKVLYSPSVSQVFNTVRDQVDSELAEFLSVATDKEIATFLRGF